MNDKAQGSESTLEEATLSKSGKDTRSTQLSLGTDADVTTTSRRPMSIDPGDSGKLEVAKEAAASKCLESHYHKVASTPKVPLTIRVPHSEGGNKVLWQCTGTRHTPLMLHIHSPPICRVCSSSGEKTTRFPV